MKKNLTICTTSKGIAEDLHCYLTLWFDQHINFTWYDGAWQLSLNANEDEIDGLTEELRHSDNYKESKITFTTEKA